MARGTKRTRGKNVPKKRKTKKYLVGNTKKQRKAIAEKAKAGLPPLERGDRVAKERQQEFDDDIETGSSEDEEVATKTSMEELLFTFSNQHRKDSDTSDTDSLTDESETNADELLENNSEDDVDIDDEDVEDQSKVESEEVEEKDLLSQHFDRIIEENLINQLLSRSQRDTKEIHFPRMGRATFSCSLPQLAPVVSVENKPCLPNIWDKKKPEIESEVYSILSSYADVLTCQRGVYVDAHLVTAVCLHALDHVLKSRTKILRHNAKLKRRSEEVEREFRDQGLTRPKVLILLPFRNSAVRYVQSMCSIAEEGTTVMNKKRFFDDYGSVNEDNERKFSRKPPDHQQMFAGNTDDNFRVGISIKKKCIRLYSPFYSSDILLASPLGLRMAVNEDHDFLSSIEILVLDQAEVLMMQNWEHVLYISEHLHLQPKESHGVDFSRVRSWSLEVNWAKCYRQTVCLSSVMCSELVAFFNRFCFNYSGLVTSVVEDTGGDILRVAVQLPQSFQRFQVNSPKEDPEERFKFFTETVLPQYSSAMMRGTLLFIPSYFDFVRLRNYFRKEELSFAQICEYQDVGKTAEARDKFFHGHRKFLFYTERTHFYKRYILKGVRHILFYQLPLIPRFYSELCNLIQLKGRDKAGEELVESSCSVLVSKYDSFRLSGVVGRERASKILSNTNRVHLLVSGDI